MSRKTVKMRQKGAQVRRAGRTDFEDLFPTGRAKSSGRKTIMKKDLSEDGTTTTYRRVAGHSSGAICTEPMKLEKAARLRRIL